MNREKVIEQFHYFNIRADIDSIYGNWAVSTEGDVVNSVYPYAILALHNNYKGIDWLDIIRTKVWFKSNSEESLQKALERANEIINRKA